MGKKLYVGNLSFSTEDSHLQTLFSDGGKQVASVRILADKFTGRSRGFGFVEMATDEDAARAISELNGKEFMGRPLTVSEAKEPSNDRPRGGFGGDRGGGRGGPRGDRGGDRGGGGRRF